MLADSSLGPVAGRPFFVAATAFVLFAALAWTHLAGEGPSHSIDTAVSPSRVAQADFALGTYVAGQMRSGSLPLWDPTQRCGVPLMINGSYSLLDPLHVLGLYFAPQAAIGAKAMASLFGMALSFWLLAKRSGLCYGAAFLGAMTYAFQPAATAAAIAPGAAPAYVWLPVAVLATREAVLRPRPAALVLGGIALGLAFLAASFWMALGLAIAIVAYAIAMVWKSPKRSMSVALVTGSLGLALALSSWRWMPLAFALAIGQPIGGAPGAFPLLPASVFGWVATVTGTADGAATPLIGFVGTLPLVLAFPAWALRGRRYETFLWVVALLGAVLACAILLPGFPSASQMLALPWALGSSVLASHGFHALLAPAKDRRSLQRWLPAAALVFGAAAALALPDSAMRGTALIGTATLLPAAVYLPLWRVSLPVIALVLFADLVVAKQEHARYADGRIWQAESEAFVSGLQAAQGQALFDRIWVQPSTPNAAYALHGGRVAGVLVANGFFDASIPSAAPYWRVLCDAELEPGAPLSLQDVAPTPLLGAMAVRVLATDMPLAQVLPRYQGTLRPLGERDDIYLYGVPDPLPRVHWTPDWVSVDSANAAIERMANGSIDLQRQTVLVGSTPDLDAVVERSEALPYAIPRVPQVLVADDTPEEIVVTSRTPQPGIVVLADAFAPGWRAELDGQRVPIHRANGMFRGVAVPSGSHEIVFSYEPPGARLGLGVSLTAAIGLLAASITALTRARLGR